jgi:adenylate cyclase
VLRVKGKQQPMAVFELMTEGPGDDRQRQLARLYEAALEAYQKQRWDDAEAHLAELLKEFPDDPPAAALADRIAELRLNPPPPDWDGVYIAHEK